MRYDYWVIRYVPDPVRDERVNVGVIAGREDDWAVRRVRTLRRAARLGGSSTASDAFFADVQRRLEAELGQIPLLDYAEGERLTRWLVEDWRVRMLNLIQLSEPRPVMAQSAQEAADLAFDLMVIDDHHEVRHRSRTQVLRRLKDAFVEDEIVAQLVRSSPTARVGEQSTKIDLAVADNEVRQLSHAWAFDLVDLDQLETNIHAWNYMIGLLRSDGGLLTLRGSSRQMPGMTIHPDVPIQVVYREPGKSEGARKLRSALDGWHHLGVEAVEERRAEQVVDNARDLVSR